MGVANRLDGDRPIRISLLAVMKPAVAIAEFEKLCAEAQGADRFYQKRSEFNAWRARARVVLRAAFGEDDVSTRDFDNVRYTVGIWTGASGEAERDARFHQQAVGNAIAVLEAAAYRLRLDAGEEPADDLEYDPELWAHVKNLVESGDWQKIASATAIFVEDRVRRWAGNPKDRNGNALVGKGLFAEVFGDQSAYRLGKQASEYEGWRALGMGFAQALGNVDRHYIQIRPDAKRYSLGILGLGSLLLTQLRYEHGPNLKGN